MPTNLPAPLFPINTHYVSEKEPSKKPTHSHSPTLPTNHLPSPPVTTHYRPLSTEEKRGIRRPLAGVLSVRKHSTVEKNS